MVVFILIIFSFTHLQMNLRSLVVHIHADYFRQVFQRLRFIAKSQITQAPIT